MHNTTNKLDRASSQPEVLYLLEIVRKTKYQYVLTHPCTTNLWMCTTQKLTKKKCQRSRIIPVRLSWHMRMVWLVFVLQQYSCCTAAMLTGYEIRTLTSICCWPMTYWTIKKSDLYCSTCDIIVRLTRSLKLERWRHSARAFSSNLNSPFDPIRIQGT